MTGPREVELKFDLEPSAFDALAVHPLVLSSAGTARDERSVYFDLPRSKLGKAGVTFRVRQSGDGFVQTIKAGSTGAGLFDRAEWESRIATGEPDLALVEKTAAAAFLHDNETRATLHPVFETRVERRRWSVASTGAEIEVLIDRGEIVAGKRRAALAELELELRQGPVSALFAIARTINRSIPLRLGVLTKSDRGYRLLRKKPDRVAKAEPVALDDGMSAADAFELIAFACIRHFRLNEPLVLGRRDAEALHQTRVALRRLRSAFSIFRPIIAGAQSDALRGELSWISGLLGEARDLDVFIGKGLGKAGDDVRGRVVAERERAYDAAIEGLGALRFRTGMIDLVEWIATGPWRSDEANAPQRDQPIEVFAATALDRFWRKVRKGGRGLSVLDDEARHDVRIAGKKLRYAGEFFAGLYAGRKRTKRRAAFLGALEALQADLGDLNDMVTAHDLSRRLAERIGIEVGRLEGRKSGDRGGLLTSAELAHVRLVDAGPFWR